MNKAGSFETEDWIQDLIILLSKYFMDWHQTAALIWDELKKSSKLPRHNIFA